MNTDEDIYGFGLQLQSVNYTGRKRYRNVNSDSRMDTGESYASTPFSGLLWAPKVRNCASPEDLLRRVETIIFYTHALLNCWRIPNPPWKQVNIEENLQNIEMQNASYYTDVCRKLFELHMQMIPYLYSAFVEYYKHGISPVRPVRMEYPDDLKARNLNDQYFFGKDMLVCPLTLEGGQERQIYLPDGVWYQYFTGESMRMISLVTTMRKRVLKKSKRRSETDRS